MRTNRPLTFARRRGFTLVEIILVVAIIMTLVSMVGPRLASQAKRAKIKTTYIELNNVKTALGNYEINVGQFPTTAQGLAALLERPSDVPENEWQEKYVDNLPKDAWGREFRYTCPSEHGKDYDLVSSGPDHKFDTTDDITNYDTSKSGSGSGSGSGSAAPVTNQ